MWSAIALSFTLALVARTVLGQETSSAQNAAAFALVYGYPLLAFQNFADQFLQYNISNFLYHARELETADNRTVVRPNVDTLYSALLYDISQADLSLQVPQLPEGQFALFSFYDPYGDNYGNVGTGIFEQHGKYLLQRPPSGTFDVGVVPRNRTIGTAELVADVYSPTTYGILLIRWLVNGTNLGTVHQLQDQTTVTASNRTDIGNAPALTSLNTPAIVRSGSPAEQVLNLLAAEAQWNLPQTSDSAIYVVEELQNAGLTGKGLTIPEDVDVAAANKSALASISDAVTNASNIENINNGWTTTPSGLAGNFQNGTNFAYRAAVAASGYLMLQAPIAIYPSWTNVSNPDQTADDGSFELAANEAWIYTFSGKPPLQTAGFWSMTVYADNYLVPNALNRYAVGDRSNLTYPGGMPVYGGSASDGAREPFQVLVQAADNPPPENWTSNWIPGPPGGGNTGVWLRFYLAEEELLNGTYEYPTVERRAAIGRDGNATSAGPSPTLSDGSGGPSSSSSSGPTDSPSTSAAEGGRMRALGRSRLLFGISLGLGWRFFT